MIRIGDAAERFDISNRTLRYWEERGILKSTRAENGYRYYDDENTMRIKQIVLLRKFEMPISDIERIFISNDLGVVINTLSGHLNNLRHQAIIHDALAVLIEELIQHIRSERSLEQVFMYLEVQAQSVNLEHEKALQILLSERDITMPVNQLNNVRIVKLPSMTVASYRAESTTPEDDCSKVFNKFVLENNLHERSDFRFFGFNNPSPSDGDPVYGYEMWVTIPDGFDVPEPLEKKQFNGGLYASISTHMNEIGERWRLLYNWCKNNEKYDVNFSIQWLEECCMDFETFISERVEGGQKQLDLLAPIKHK